LEELTREHSCVRDVRGKGLMIGMELSSKELADKVVVKARENGFLINATADNVLRFVPPLVIERRHIDCLIKVLDKILEEMGQ